MKKILLTGGGSAGHVVPNLAIIKELQNKNWQIFYVGSKNSIEEKLITRKNIPFFTIPTGKLRRYFSWQNFIDPFKILCGIIKAFFIIKKIGPNVVFSKGGFVAFPVVIAAWINRIPVVAHESDLTPGLANKLSFPFVNNFCVNFEETKKYFKNKNKITVTGNPIRNELLSGNPNNGRKICGFANDKPIILIYGGSSGSQKINAIIKDSLPKLLPDFYIAHICGHKLERNSETKRYKQFAFLHEELADVMAAADIVISRAGANSIYELLTLNKPHILIPLSENASRGDQIVNAKYFTEHNLSEVVFEQSLTPETLYKKILFVDQNKESIKQNLATLKKQNSSKLIYDILCSITGFSNK